jgi:hypothetical protein
MPRLSNGRRRELVRNLLTSRAMIEKHGGGIEDTIAGKVRGTTANTHRILF